MDLLIIVRTPTVGAIVVPPVRCGGSQQHDVYNSQGYEHILRRQYSR